MKFCQLKPWLGHPCASCSNLVGSPGGTERQILAIGDQLHPGVPGGRCAVTVQVTWQPARGTPEPPHLFAAARPGLHFAKPTVILGFFAHEC